MNVLDARADLVKLLRDTAQTVAPDVPAEVRSDPGPTPCQSDVTGQILDTESARLVLVVKVEPNLEKDALKATVAAWEKVGVELDRSRIDDVQPEVLGRRPGYGVRVLAVEGSGQLALTGETDCLAPADG